MANQLLIPGPDLENAAGAVGKLIPVVLESNHPDKAMIAKILGGVIEHLDRQVASSAHALLSLAGRMAAGSP
ncbi:MAG TPA: hypothetical protein VG273_04470 [Bryobacteraceae bacterium]|nr:hypothetical protein [Bryobacteraceae bacterium]